MIGPASILELRARSTPEQGRRSAVANSSECERARITARVRAAGSGDAQAQRWLVETALADVRAVARALVGDAHDADDAAQCALLQLLTAAAHYRGDASLRYWARCVATRAVLKYRARLRRKQAREAHPLEGFDLAAAPGCDAGEALPRSLRAYLAELPPEQGEALVLHHALGYSVPEIAELTEVSPNTVKGRLRLGTKALRRRVRQEMLIGARRSEEARR